MFKQGRQGGGDKGQATSFCFALVCLGQVRPWGEMFVGATTVLRAVLASPRTQHGQCWWTMWHGQWYPGVLFCIMSWGVTCLVQMLMPLYIIDVLMWASSVGTWLQLYSHPGAEQSLYVLCKELFLKVLFFCTMQQCFHSKWSLFVANTMPTLWLCLTLVLHMTAHQPVDLQVHILERNVAFLSTTLWSLGFIMVSVGDHHNLMFGVDFPSSTTRIRVLEEGPYRWLLTSSSGLSLTSRWATHATSSYFHIKSCEENKKQKLGLPPRTKSQKKERKSQGAIRIAVNAFQKEREKGFEPLWRPLTIVVAECFAS